MVEPGAPHSINPDNKLTPPSSQHRLPCGQSLFIQESKNNHPGGVYSAGATQKGNPTATRSAKRDETRRRRSPATSTFQTSRSSSFLCTIEGVFFYWRRQWLDFAFSEWLCICVSICALEQSESIISLSRSATRCLLARLLSDDHRRHHPVLYRCGPRIPIDILSHLLTWVYYYRFQVSSAYVHCIGPDAYRETSPGQWVPINPPLAVQDCPCHIRKAA